MLKEDYDIYYHILRKASNECAGNTRKQEEASRLLGLARHLLGGGDYLALIQYSAMYGEKFLIKPAIDLITKEGLKPTRVIDIGAGLGWLGRGLTLKLMQGCISEPDLVTVDKRNWSMITERLDIEDKDDRDYLIHTYPPDGSTLVTMCEFLHCTDNQKEIVDAFYDYDLLVIEYVGFDEDSFTSYQEQLRRYGAMMPTIADLKYALGEPVINSSEAMPFLISLKRRKL